MRLSTLLLVTLAAATQLPAQSKSSKKPVELTQASVESREVVYKQTPEGELKLHFYLPPKAEIGLTVQKPCVVFFFGGGWKNGTYAQFVSQAKYLASRGLITACADYRILNVHKTLPDKAVEDAKSAIRWVRAHADEFGIDPGKIIASGGSAGGHLAASTALVKAYDAPGEGTVSAIPNALVLFNPAMNIGTLYKERASSGEKGMTQEMADAITPNSFLTKDSPPAIFFFGTDDKLKLGADEYLTKARELGLKAEMWTAEGQGHGFFNREPWMQITARQMDLFLTSLGYLGGEPAITLPAESPALKRQE